MSKRIILDTETTGLNEGLKLDVPVSIAVLDYDTGEVLMNTLVRSDVEIDAEASAVHGITAVELVGKPWLIDVSYTLIDLFEEADQIEAYNAPFDMRIIANAFWKALQSPSTLHGKKWRDVMTTYSILWNQPHKYREGQRNVSLTSALEMQGLPLAQAHNALADAAMTLRLIKHMESGQVRPFREGGLYPVNLVSLTRKYTPKAGTYASFLSAGGQMVNVFEKQFGVFHSFGHKLHDCLYSIEENETLTLEKPIAATVTFRDGWCNVFDVKEKDAES